jgi:hypothetical protein
VSRQTFANMSSNALMTEINTITDMQEDILATFSSSLTLKSCIFNKLAKNSGANWENKKFKDCFQINCSEINYFTVLILSDLIDKRQKNNKNPHKEM